MPKKRFYSDQNNAFSSNADVFQSFDVSQRAGIKIIYAWYDEQNYEGEACVYFKQRGKYYSVHASHCSCEGLENQWLPEEINLQNELIYLEKTVWPYLIEYLRREAGRVEQN